jgi:acetyl esterase/lipase
MYGAAINLVAQDLANAGYYTLVVSYRLAPCDVIKEQPCHDVDALTGRPPQQTDDIKAEIRAIRADTTHCKDGKVAIVGGSAGGSHALFLALDTITTTTWNATLRPTCVVSLSGAYDLSDRTPENYGPHHASPVEGFAYDAFIYVNDSSLTVQKMKSPIWLVSTPTQAKPFIPCMLINSQYDEMPYHQPFALACAFQSKGIDPALYPIITVPDASDHAFALWFDSDGSLIPIPISGRVIAFLDAHMKP